ncbi:MAG: hypothetical protein KAU14_06865 [Thermoplasmata archaeon]|nr:hypothetical protein [Thermoplasmata archaeon]
MQRATKMIAIRVKKKVRPHWPGLQLPWAKSDIEDGRASILFKVSISGFLVLQCTGTLTVRKKPGFCAIGFWITLFHPWKVI